ncbi:MAG: alanine racemase [Hyphomonadaceae bacterium]|nr:alanine racemase [Hyphomonadaceae bacterium]
MTRPSLLRSRRGLLIGAGAAGAVALAASRRPPDRGGGHSDYFLNVSRALTEAGFARPTLVVDRSLLLTNADAAAATLSQSGLALRLVVKSLPAFGLLDPLAERLRTNRYMVFNGAMLQRMAEARPEADLLLGKPLPVREAAEFMARTPLSSAPQWLIDTPQRLTEYIEAARARSAPLRVNFEIDVGLHRGGFPDAAALAAALDIASAEPLVEICGLMGYDPHVPRMPNAADAFLQSQASYREAIECLTSKVDAAPAALTLNSAGSPTYKLHAAGTVANEVSVGSAFVKPVDFDLDTLAHHQPAAFIATPVIKALDGARIPGLEALEGVFALWDPNSARAFFIYGGHWLARPESPPGLQYSSMFGRSSNQEMLTGSRRVRLDVDDWVFLRPLQSEAVFLQFGPIAIYEEGRIVDVAETFPVSA